MERAEKIGLGVAAVGHLALFGALSLSLLARDKPKLGDPTVEITIAGDPGSSELLSESLLPISQPISAEEPVEEDPIEEFEEAEAEAEVEPEDSSPPADNSSPPPDRSAEKKKKREAEAKKRRDTAAKKKRAAEERRRKMAEANRKQREANARNAANSGPPAKNAGQVKGEVNILIGSQIKPFLRGCTPSGVDVRKIITSVTLKLNRNGSLAGISGVRQRGVNDNNRQQAKPMEACVTGAIRRAAPFKGLDTEYFNVWQNHKMAFRGT